MTDKSSDEINDYSDGETIWDGEDESMNTSDEAFIDDEGVSLNPHSSDEDEYIPPYKRQNLKANEIEERIKIKFENGKWIFSIVNV